jgi:ABC-type branched-subunit amino acid transport system substrate-binding protein
LAYDTARLLSLAATVAGPDRDALRRALSDVSLSDPAAGGRRFGANREVERDMVVLTIAGSRIREWSGEPAVP